MTALREAAQQALEFFDAEFGWSPGEAPRIDALRAALAQQAEPVPGAWVASPDGRVIYDDVSADDGLLRVSGDFENDEQRVRYAQRIVDKLNAAPPQRKPLTEEAAALTAQRDALLRVLKDCEIALRTVAKSDDEFVMARHQVREVRAVIKAVEEAG